METHRLKGSNRSAIGVGVGVGVGVDGARGEEVFKKEGAQRLLYHVLNIFLTF